VNELTGKLRGDSVDEPSAEPEAKPARKAMDESAVEPVNDRDESIEPSPGTLVSGGKIASVSEPVCARPLDEPEKGERCIPASPSRLLPASGAGTGLPLSVALLIT